MEQLLTEFLQRYFDDPPPTREEEAAFMRTQVDPLILHAAEDNLVVLQRVLKERMDNIMFPQSGMDARGMAQFVFCLACWHRCYEPRRARLAAGMDVHALIDAIRGSPNEGEGRRAVQRCKNAVKLGACIEQRRCEEGVFRTPLERLRYYAIRNIITENKIHELETLISETEDSIHTLRMYTDPLHVLGETDRFAEVLGMYYIFKGLCDTMDYMRLFSPDFELCTRMVGRIEQIQSRLRGTAPRPDESALAFQSHAIFLLLEELRELVYGLLMPQYPSRIEAVAMGFHPRLGAGSRLRWLDPHLVHNIAALSLRP